MQNEQVGDDEVFDKLHVPRTYIIDGEPEQDKVAHISPTPYPHRLRALKKVNNHSEIYELFKQVKLNIPLLDAIKKISSDPGSPIIFPKIQRPRKSHYFHNGRELKVRTCFSGLGGKCQLVAMVYVELGLGELEPTNITLQLAGRSVKIPRGIVKDVLVQVDKFYFLVDFFMLDTQPGVNQGTQFPVILGRPFLATANAIIHCRGGLMALSFGNMAVNLNIFNVIKEMGDEEDVCEANMIDSVVHKYVENVSYDDPLMACLVTPSWVEEVTTSESTFLHSIIKHSEVLEANGWTPKFEPLPPIENRVLPSEERPPKLELKPLPSHLKYAFLGVEETFPVIISSSLELDQENKLLEI